MRVRTKNLKERMQDIFAVVTSTLLVLNLFFLGVTPAFAVVPTTTIVGWTFPSGSADKYADVGIAANVGISELEGDHLSGERYDSNGIDSGTDKAAAAKDWDYNSGYNANYWYIEFSTTGYKTLTLSSKQRSENDGPRDFHIDYSLNNGSTWTKVSGSDYQITNASWNNSGALNNLTLPSALDNQAKVILRWQISSNHRAAGSGTINNDGYNSIDNIYVNAAAKATYTVTFDSKGGSSVSPITNVQYGNTITKPTDPTKVNYYFIGWYKDACCTDDWNFTTDVVNANTTLYAKWGLNRYILAYNGNGNTGGLVPDSNRTYDYGTEIEVYGNDAGLYKTGYTFNDWNTKADGTGTTYSEGDEITMSQDVTLYAQWQINTYEVDFHSNGGTHIDDMDVIYNELITKPTDPTRNHYVFSGWYLDDNTFAQPWNFSTMRVTGETDLYAKWVKEAYTVIFNSNGGTPVDSQQVEDGDEIIEPTDPTKPGYTFDGWYSDSALTSAWDFNDDVESNMTLYAKWIANKYTIYFDTNGGSEIAPITADYGSSISAPANPTRPGYIFTGWSPAFPSTMPLGGKTLVAQWRLVTTPTTSPSTPITPIVIATGVAGTTGVTSATTTTTTTTTTIPQTTTTTKAEEVKGTATEDKGACPWWWIILLILVAGTSVYYGYEHNKERKAKLLYAWPVVFGLAAWLIHKYLHDGYEDTIFCKWYWAIVPLAILILTAIYWLFTDEEENKK